VAYTTTIVSTIIAMLITHAVALNPGGIRVLSHQVAAEYAKLK